MDKRSPAYRRFQRRYRYDPVGFARDCIDWRGGNLHAYQADTLNNLVKHKREAVRGPHGLGKSTDAAIAILWFALTRDGEDWKIPTTASAWRQLTKYLWPEVHKWARRLRWHLIGREPFDTRHELLYTNLKLATGEAFAIASNQPELIEGAHAEQMLIIFDEAKAIPDRTWDALEGAFTGPGEKYALAISTPGDTSGRFHAIHKHEPGYEDWHTKHVTLEEAIAAGRLTWAWAKQRLKQWGEKSAVYQNRVLGEFAAGDEDSVIPLAWIELANQRWQQWDDAGRPGRFACVAIDVGRGGDKSTYAHRYDVDDMNLRVIAKIDEDNVADTMHVADTTLGVLDGKGGYAIVDVIGIGAGVFDRLRQLKKKVFAFNAGKATSKRDRSKELGFRNVRAAAWWNLREQLDPDFGSDIGLPPDDELTGDLTAVKQVNREEGKIQIEPKDQVRERIGRSPDRGDAVVEAFWAPVQYAASVYG
jgi:hypothetical protein